MLRYIHNALLAIVYFLSLSVESVLPIWIISNLLIANHYDRNLPNPSLV